MKTPLTLSLLFLVSCAVGQAPHFPEDLKDYFVTVVDGEPLPKEFENRITNIEDMMFSDDVSVHCLQLEVVSKHPVTLKYIQEVKPSSCHLVGGFVPRDTKHLFNWIDDMWSWAETRKKCFR